MTVGIVATIKVAEGKNAEFEEIFTGLAKQVRADTVICRMGGDEIAVLLPGCSDDVAMRRAQELLDAVHAHPYLLADGTLIAISVSIGVAQVPAHAQGVERLYSVADQALYLAKRGGRGRISAPPRRDGASVSGL